MSDRNFKGIWIPAEIWETKALTLTQKCFIVEIDSLDNEQGCFASNSYFAQFFDMHESNVSRVIKNLENKGYISIDYEKNGKQIIKRTIKLNRKLSSIRYYQNDNGVLSNCNGGYYQNSKDNNTYINNTINKTKTIEEPKEFTEFWSLYPRKTNRKGALQSWIKEHIDENTFPLLIESLNNQKRSINWTKDNGQYIPHPATWINQHRWEDVIELPKEEVQINKPKLREI